MAPSAEDAVDLYPAPSNTASFQDYWLEPQEEDEIFSEIWIDTPQMPQPVFAQVEVRCPQYENAQPRVWIRRIHFILEDFNA